MDIIQQDTFSSTTSLATNIDLTPPCLNIQRGTTVSPIFQEYVDPNLLNSMNTVLNENTENDISQKPTFKPRRPMSNFLRRLIKERTQDHIPQPTITFIKGADRYSPEELQNMATTMTSTDPTSIFEGQPIFFKGINTKTSDQIYSQDNDVAYLFKIEFRKNVEILSLQIQGMSFYNSKIILLDSEQEEIASVFSDPNDDKPYTIVLNLDKSENCSNSVSENSPEIYTKSVYTESFLNHSKGRIFYLLERNSAKYVFSRTSIKIQAKTPQHSNFQLLEDLSSMLNNPLFSDVAFQITGSELIHANKGFLASRCQQFKAMFFGGMQEASQTVVDLPETDYEAFLGLLEFLHTGFVKDLNFKRAIRIYIIADRYTIDELKEGCEYHIHQSVTKDTALEILLLAWEHGLNSIVAFTLDYVIRNRKSMLTQCDNIQELENQPKLLLKIITAIALI